MAYGITDESQLIDINQIMNGVKQYRDAIAGFEKSGKAVISASEICTADVLSVDDNSLQYPIETLGTEIQKLQTQLNAIADEFVFQAQLVRQQQYNELIAYRNQQAQIQQQQAQQQIQPQTQGATSL